MFGKWERAKEEIKLAIERSSEITFQSRVRERELERALDILCGAIHEGHTTESEDIKRVESQLKN